MADYIPEFLTLKHVVTKFFLLASDLSCSVQSSRWDGTIFLMIPGTSCLAIIVLVPPGQALRAGRSTPTNVVGYPTRVQPQRPERLS